MIVRFRVKNREVECQKYPLNLDFLKNPEPKAENICNHDNHPKSIFCVVSDNNEYSVGHWTKEDTQVDLKITDNRRKWRFCVYFWHVSSKFQSRAQNLMVQLLDR